MATPPDTTPGAPRRAGDGSDGDDDVGGAGGYGEDDHGGGHGEDPFADAEPDFEADFGPDLQQGLGHDFGPPPDFHGVPDVEFDAPPPGASAPRVDAPGGGGSGGSGAGGGGRGRGRNGFGDGPSPGPGPGGFGGPGAGRRDDLDDVAARLSAVRRPPQSIEAEQAVLGGLVVNAGESFEKVAEVVVEDDFYQENHRLIFRAVGALLESNRNADIVTVIEWLRERGLLERAGGLDYVAALVEVTPSASNVKAYAEIVRERSVLRQLIAVANDIADSAFDSEGRTSKDLLDEAETKVFAIADQSSKSAGGFQDIKQVLAGAIDKITYLFESDAAVTGLETGFTDLDEKTSGLQKSDLIIVAGRPSMGKTTFAMNLAEHVAMSGDLPVAVFSMEMPAEQLALRLISSLGRVELQKIRTGKLGEQDWPRITSAITMLNQKRNVYIDDTPALTPTDLRARARRLAREHGLGLIVIDYLQLMQLANSKENRATEISEISRSLKALAKELDVPVVALSQLNRSLEQRPDKRPVMSDLRECVVGDTLVTLADGTRRPIESLVGDEPEVLSVDAAGGIRTSKAVRVWKVGERSVFRVRLASGRSITCTAEHRLLGFRGWRRVGELEAGDRLAVPRRVPEPRDARTVPDHEIVLLAHLIGDGSYLEGRPLRHTTMSEANSRAVKEAALAMGGVVNRRAGPGKAGWHQLEISGNGNRWHPAGAGGWLEELGEFDERSAAKSIPDRVFRLPDEKLALFVRHLWSTDGSITVGHGGRSRVHITGVSRRLIDDVASLLLRFDIVARIGRVGGKGPDSRWFTADVHGVENKRRYASRIGGFGHQESAIEAMLESLSDTVANTDVDTVPAEVLEDVQALMSERSISFHQMAQRRGATCRSPSNMRAHSPSRDTLGSYLQVLGRSSLDPPVTDDLFWDRVVSVEPEGMRSVFDMTVPGDACFIACDVVSHNSGAIEQDADVIMFVYRDEVYHPENEESHGRAEILIRKQRNGPIGVCHLTFQGKFVRFDDYSPEIRGAEFE